VQRQPGNLNGNAAVLQRRTGLAAPGDAAASCRACVGSSAENQLDTPAASLLTLKSSAGPAPAPPLPPNSCTQQQTRADE